MTSRVAVITGGGQGLGRAIASGLAALGHRVALFGRSAAKVEEAARLIGENALGVAVDVSDHEAVAAAFARVDRQLGAPTVLVNNAAVFLPFIFDESDEAPLEATIQTNLMGPIHCMRQAFPRMRAAGYGHVVNISSESVRRPYPLLSVYAASKSALETLSVALREEYRPTGIRVTVVRAGRMLTEGAEGLQMSPEVLERFISGMQQLGLHNFSGVGMSAATVASAVINAIETPSDAHVDLIEIRSP